MEFKDKKALQLKLPRSLSCLVQMQRLTLDQNSHAYQINDYINIHSACKGQNWHARCVKEFSRLHISTDWREKKRETLVHIFMCVYLWANERASCALFSYSGLCSQQPERLCDTRAIRDYTSDRPQHNATFCSIGSEERERTVWENDLWKMTQIKCKNT